MAVEDLTRRGSQNYNVIATSKEIVGLLISLGVESNTAKTLMCLHTHGPSKSIELQKNCNLRQPDVSIAISKLSNLGILSVVTSSKNGRGRPSNIYELSVPLEEAILPFKQDANQKIKLMENQLILLSKLTNAA